MTYKWGTIQQAKVKRDENVRYQGGVKSPILTSVAKGDLVTVLEQLENWTKIATADGYIGYVRNKRLGSVTEMTISNEFTEPEYTRIKKDYTINLVWHQISNMDSNYALSSDIESMTGVNTISPTWFSVQQGRTLFLPWQTAAMWRQLMRKAWKSGAWWITSTRRWI